MSSIILSGSINGGKKCNICLKIYKASYIQTHLVYTHGKGKQNKCDICIKIFATKFRLNEHTKSIHVENWKIKLFSKCPKEFNSLVNYSQHYRICHKNSEVVSCNICNKEFTGNPKLNEHLRKNHLKLDCNKCSLKWCPLKYPTLWYPTLYLPHPWLYPTLWFTTLILPHPWFYPTLDFTPP